MFLSRCRVDYIHGQTTFDSHNLELVELPGQPRILLGSQEVTSGWLEVKENSSVSLLCVSEGARPPANITWWLDDILLEDSSER